MTEADGTTPDDPPAAPRRFRWRRLVQYRLRTFLVIVALIAAWLGWWSNRARQQREAVAALTKAGASVEYHSRGGVYDLPQWMLDNLGVDYYASVYTVTFPTSATDIDLKNLQGLNDLQGIDLGNTRVTDAGLEHLCGLPGLQSLHINSTKITDAGLDHLKDLTSLQQLSLGNTQVTDAGLEHLQRLTALEDIFLYHTQVTDAGVARLKKSLPNCNISH